MPSSVAPKISWHQVTGYSTAADGTESPAQTSTFEFGVKTVQDSDVPVDAVRFRIKNDNGCADAINPIIYLAGQDNTKLSEEEWVKGRRRSHRARRAPSSYSRSGATGC
jgi:hypothetical protein